MPLKLSKNIPVFCLHDVADRPKDQWTISAKQFEDFLKYLKKRSFITIHASEVHSKNYEPKTVAITFDDGLSGVFEHALPLLKKYDYTATVFVSTAYTNRMFNESTRALSDEQIKDLIDSGIEIGSHAHNHVNIKKMSRDEQLSQLTQSKELLEERYNIHVKTFAYPYGQYDEQLVGIVGDTGYSSAFSVFQGITNLSNSQFAYDRLEVSSSWHPAVRLEYWLKTSGWYLF